MDSFIASPYRARSLRNLLLSYYAQFGTKATIKTESTVNEGFRRSSLMIFIFREISRARSPLLRHELSAQVLAKIRYVYVGAASLVRKSLES